MTIDGILDACDKAKIQYHLWDCDYYTIPEAPLLAAEVRRLRERERVLVDALKTDIEAMNMVIKDKAPSYHDCTDDGLPKCAWCFIMDAQETARAAIEAVKE